MAYIVSKEIAITRHEGDTSEIQIIVPDVLPMSNFTEVIFQARENLVESGKIIKGAGSLVFEKKKSTGGILVDGQSIRIIIDSIDTKGKSGNHSWELEISNDDPEIITIGKGIFKITREIINV